MRSFHAHALTAGSRRGEDKIRRIAIVLLTTLGGLVTRPARSEEPSGLLARALRRAELARAPDWSERVSRARFAPTLTLGAGIIQGPASHAVEVYARLAWPFGRGELTRTRAVLGESARLSERREALTDEVTSRWGELIQRRQAPHADDLREAIDSQLDLDEAEANLRALVGDAP